MRFKFGVNDALAKHDDTAGVTLFAGGGEVEQETPPHSQFSVLIALEPESAQINGVVQQHYVHGFAVPVSSLQDKVFDGFGPPPVPDGETGDKQPEEGC